MHCQKIQLDKPKYWTTSGRHKVPIERKKMCKQTFPRIRAICLSLTCFDRKRSWPCRNKKMQSEMSTSTNCVTTSLRFQCLHREVHPKLNTSNQIIKLTLRAGLASGWKTERALIALTRTPIGWASWGIACIMSWKTNSWRHPCIKIWKLLMKSEST